MSIRLRPLLVGLLLSGAAAAGLEAQTSVYSVLGIGMPGRSIGVRTRALGGAAGVVDPASPLNPAAATGYGRLTASASTGAFYRSYEVDGVSTAGLRDTRFPLAVVGGPLGSSPFYFAVGYGTYADRTYDLQTSDTIVLRGQPVAVEDRMRSVGTLADTRGALAWSPARGISVGVAAHVLSGSTRENLQRSFADSSYLPLDQRREAHYTGVGVSVGVMVTPTPWLRLGAAARSDTRLEAEGGLMPNYDVDLPLSLSAGFMIAPAAGLRWTAGATWRSWSGAGAELAARGGARAFDTFEVGTGIELGGAEAGPTRLPLRVGVRYATLPFSPTDDQPHELDLALGTGLPIAGGRVVMDLAVERALRDGGRASERAWQVFVGVTVRP